MLDMLLGAAALVSLQDPQNPLNIPVPTPEELARCFPTGVTAATPLNSISRPQLRAMVACANGLVARNINSITPVRIDPLTTLVSAETSGTTLQYNSRVDVEAGAIRAEQRQAIEQSTRAYVCTQREMVQSIGYGGAYRYVWNDRNGRLVHQVLIDRCP